MERLPERQLFIDGKWVESHSRCRLPVFCPATEAQVGTIAAGNAGDVNAAVTAAVVAFRKRHLWSGIGGATRAAVLRSIAQEIKARKEELSRMETVDCGKPLEESEWDMDDVAGCFEYYAGLAEQLDARQGEAVDVGTEEFLCTLRREALGPVGLITPWNYPLLMATWKVAPALAAGCTVVLKPSELASATCLELADICRGVGVPPGVFNVVPGTGPEAGAALSAHPALAKLAFTGSTATGRAVSLAAARNLRPCTLELGGKSAVLVFDDVEVDDAVEWVMFGCFWTNGQICTATSRLLVQDSIAPRFYARLKARSQAIRIGDPLQQGCRLGPVISATQHAKVLDYIQSGVAEGASLLCGGGRPPGLARGWFVQPTVLTNVTPGMAVWRQEIFGPVLSCMTFSAEPTAIQLANDSEYGLGAAVLSADPERCRRVAAQLEAGIVWVNCSQPCFCQAPWGGVKNSGHGRELGPWGLDNFLSVKQITAYVARDRWPWYPTEPAATPRL